MTEQIIKALGDEKTHEFFSAAINDLKLQLAQRDIEIIRINALQNTDIALVKNDLKYIKEFIQKSEGLFVTKEVFNTLAKEVLEIPKKYVTKERYRITELLTYSFSGAVLLSFVYKLLENVGLKSPN